MEKHSIQNTDFTFIKNDALKTLSPDAHWQGNRIDSEGRFSNVNNESFIPSIAMVWRMMKGGNPQKKFKKKDKFKIPTITDLSFLENKNDVIIWFGHASFFIRINGIALVIDPVFRGLPFIKRKSDLPFDMNLIKDLDYILISHDHRDHLDDKSLQLIYKNSPNATLLTGLKMEEWLNKILPNPTIQTAGWFQQYNTDQDKVKIYFMPARHWSRRNIKDINKHLWGGFIIQSAEKTIYFSGDTGYGPHFAQISKLFPKIDVCIMGIGAYKPEWFMHYNHISPLNAIKANNEMNTLNFIPMHYGTFDLSNEPIGEPIQIVQAHKDTLNANLQDLKIGENYYF